MSVSHRHTMAICCCDLVEVGFPFQESLGRRCPTLDRPPAGVGEDVWIDVIRKMDEVYSDLLQYEVALEEKNAKLEETQKFIFSVLTSMSDVLVVCDRHGVIQLNRPEKMNALSHNLRAELFNALKDFELDPEVKVIIIRGSGRAFSAGMRNSSSHQAWPSTTR